jgi:2-phospho-L-lactate guanylyltransferase
VSADLVAVVPVKALAEAKSRLAPRLSPAARADLVLTMLDRVLAAVQASGQVGRCVVVSPDPAVRERAARAGATPLDEAPAIGEVPVTRHNAALGRARALALAWRPGALLVLAADLPFLTVANLQALAALGARDGTVVLAPDRAGTGTNALLLRPPGALPFCFGPDSYATHRQAAEERGLAVQLYRAPGTAFDLDQPADLDQWLTGGPGPALPLAAAGDA